MLLLCYKYISLGWILLLLTHLSLFLWMTTFKKTATFSFLRGLGNWTGDTENKDEFCIARECKIAGRLPMCWQQEPFKLRWQNISGSLSWSFRLVLPQAGNNWLFSVWCPTNKWYSYFFFIYIWLGSCMRAYSMYKTSSNLPSLEACTELIWCATGLRFQYVGDTDPQSKLAIGIGHLCSLASIFCWW